MEISTKVGKADVEGIWVKHPTQEGVQFKIARAGNPVYWRAHDKAERPHAKQVRTGKLSTEKTVEIQCKAMAEGILLDWKGLTNGGEDFPYSAENAFLVLRHNPEVREFVIDEAASHENFRETEVKATAKKSSNS